MHSVKHLNKETCFFKDMDPEISLNLAINILSFLSIVLSDYQPAEESKSFSEGLSSVLLILEKILSQAYEKIWGESDGKFMLNWYS